MSSTNPLSSVVQLQSTMIDATRSATETGIEAQRTAVGSWFDAAESTKSVQESGVALSKSAVDAYLDGLKTVVPEESVAELETAVDEAYEAGGEIHGDAWETVTESLEEAEATYEEMTDTQLELLAQGFDAVEEMQGEAEEAADEVVAAAEELTDSA